MAASSFLDVCRFNPTLGGTTDWTFSGAVTGYQSPAAAGAVNGAQYSYRAESADLSQWEIGAGVYNTSTGVLTRATVLKSTNANAKVSFSAAPQVAIVALAEDLPPMTVLTNSLSADVSMTSTTQYFDGPTISQGTAGTFLVSGAITLQDLSASVGCFVKLWDGSTVVASATCNSAAASQRAVVALSGVITNPAGNLRISAKTFAGSTTCKIKFDGTDGNNKDSTITAVRIN